MSKFLSWPKLSKNKNKNVAKIVNKKGVEDGCLIYLNNQSKQTMKERL